MNQVDEIFNKALVAFRHDRYLEAIDFFTMIVDEVTEPHKILMNISLSYKRLLNKEKALYYINESIKAYPYYVGGNICKFETLAYFGDYSEAFKYQEWVFGDSILKHFSLDDSKKRRLDYSDTFVEVSLNNREDRKLNYGESESYSDILSKVKNKTIYIMPSQGLGDVIQCSYYVKELLKYKPKKIILGVANPLMRVLYDIEPNIEVITYTPYESEFDYFIPIFSLMKLLNGDDIPKEGWLTVSKKDEKFFKGLLMSSNKTKIGIVWRGNPKHSNDAVRSMALSEMLNKISDKSNIDLYSLQYDVTIEEKEILDAYGIIDLSSYIRDLYDVGCFLKNLNLFICIDSAPIHLAGALGVNSICLLPERKEDWRWGFDGKYKHYSSVKLIRFTRDV
jgi:ADP-heptose:LPS heptosyltransferase